GEVEEELGISIDDEAETEQSAEVFRRLRIGREQTSLTPLFEGEFPETEDLRKAEIEPTSSAQAPRRASKAAARFHCEICNEDFERRSQFDRHMATSHPPQAPSAADVERALGGIDFPASLRDLVAHASRQLPSEAPVHALIR